MLWILRLVLRRGQSQYKGVTRQKGDSRWKVLPAHVPCALAPLFGKQTVLRADASLCVLHIGACACVTAPVPCPVHKQQSSTIAKCISLQAPRCTAAENAHTIMLS